ncbi:MAG: Uma2 family endonuclease [Methylococcales bacterium]|jgi:Uma2 family endonuclease|nr:Uma2 family endonuclease [Methylococcales bacterium]MBT7410030.1 Uma2 family endonuclease [Methylococcales bacterium]
MILSEKNKMKAEDYLIFERSSELRHEFVDGAIFSMAGASKKHNQISSNLVRMIGNDLLKKPCNIYSSDMRVKNKNVEKYSYPDVVVSCYDENFEDEEEDTLLNPIMIIEILSDSTEAYDRGDKFFYYRQIESFIEYILVSQKSCHVEKYNRQSDNTWLFSEFKVMDDIVELTSINSRLSLRETYDKVKI